MRQQLGEVMHNTSVEHQSTLHVNKVMNQIVRCDLGADLIHARENSNNVTLPILPSEDTLIIDVISLCSFLVITFIWY